MAGNFRNNWVDSWRQYVVEWDDRDSVGRQVSSGIYLYRLHVKDFVETKKMIMVQ